VHVLHIGIGLATYMGKPKPSHKGEEEGGRGGLNGWMEIRFIGKKKASHPAFLFSKRS